MVVKEVVEYGLRWLIDTIDVSGDLLAIKGGGGSGGSIYIKAHRM
jgi:hypothetical protein